VIHHLCFICCISHNWGWEGSFVCKVAMQHWVHVHITCTDLGVLVWLLEDCNTVRHAEDCSVCSELECVCIHTKMHLEQLDTGLPLTSTVPHLTLAYQASSCYSFFTDTPAGCSFFSHTTEISTLFMTWKHLLKSVLHPFFFFFLRHYFKITGTTTTFMNHFNTLKPAIQHKKLI
jgi:hypothetical protein